MKIAFECHHCGKCCGPVPVSDFELVRIRRTLRKMDRNQIEQLKAQDRDSMTCPLWDTENRRCSVYDARPEICRMFGYYKEMVCPNNEELAVKSRHEGQARLNSAYEGSEIAGVMGIDFTWDNLIKQ